MGPEVLLVVLLALAVVGLPLVILIVLAQIRGRQESQTDDLTRLLRRIDRDLDHMRQALERLRPGEAPPEAEAAVAPAPSPAVRPIVAEEVFEPAPPAPQPPPPEPVEPAPPDLTPQARMLMAWTSEEPTSESELPPREPSRFESAACETLRKIRNWIVFGADELPEDVSLEYAVATNWLLRIGVVILVMGLGFFLKYSIDQGWITPDGRILLAAAVGLGMLVAGTQMLGRHYHLFGQGLIGGGIATLYFSVFAAFNIYHRVDVTAAFGLMIAVTCLAGWIAVRFDSLLVAVLGIIGGYATPVMLSTGVVNFPGLFTYLLILGLGILAVSHRKDWPLLNYLGFVGTYGLFFATLNRYYRPEDFWQVMPFLAGFFVLYSTAIFLFNVVHGKKATLLEVLALVLNAGIFFAASYALIAQRYDSKWAAAVSLSLAAFYAAHVYYFLLRRLVDRELMLSFTALSAFFLAVTIPLVLSREWITASWALQALVMLWIAGKLESQFLRHTAYLLYAIVFWRFGFLDLPRQYFIGGAAMNLPLGQYLADLVERLAMLGVPIASVAGAGWLHWREPAPAALAVERGNDTPALVRTNWALVAAVVAVVAMLFVGLHLELNQTVGYFFPPLRLPMLTMLWIALAGLLMFAYLRRPNDALLVLLVSVLGGLGVKLVLFDLPAWHILPAMRYGGDYSLLEASMRLVDFAAIIGLLVAGAYLLAAGNRATSDRTLGTIFGAAALGLLFVFTTLELNTVLYHFVPGLQAGGVSILWSIFALAMVVAGIWRQARALRYVGLALFAVVASKVLLLDLARLDQFYRIVAFILLGVLVMSGSAVYLKYRSALTVRPAKGEQP